MPHLKCCSILSPALASIEWKDDNESATLAPIDLCNWLEDAELYALHHVGLQANVL
jgi:hypothetical protein